MCACVSVRARVRVCECVRSFVCVLMLVHECECSCARGRAYVARAFVSNDRGEDGKRPQAARVRVSLSGYSRVGSGGGGAGVEYARQGTVSAGNVWVRAS